MFAGARMFWVFLAEKNDYSQQSYAERLGPVVQQSANICWILAPKSTQNLTSCGCVSEAAFRKEGSNYLVSLVEHLQYRGNTARAAG